MTELTRTFGDNPLQAYDVLMGELAHDASLAQEVLPLLLGVARFQCLYRYSHLITARQLQDTAVHLTKLSYGTKKRQNLSTAFIYNYNIHYNIVIF